MKDVIENFDKSAARYENFAAPQAALAKTLSTWIATSERNGSAIEIGAGTGLFTREMLPWSGTYSATDAAPNMVAQGRRNCPEANWQIMDACEPVRINQHNWVFACSILQWLSEPQKILAKWQNALTDDGHLVMAVLLPRTLGELQSLLPEARQLHWRPALEWQVMVKKAGFIIERQSEWEQKSIYSTSHELLRAVHSMGLAPRQSVGPGRLRTVLREYDQKFATPDGVSATWRAWLVRARVAARP